MFSPQETGTKKKKKKKRIEKCKNEGGGGGRTFQKMIYTNYDYFGK